MFESFLGFYNNNLKQKHNNMEDVINKMSNYLKEVYYLKSKLDNKEYWINRAKEEAGFIPKEGDWISVEVTLWLIRVSVYHNHTDHNLKEARYWLNGEWFDTPFPKKYSNL